MLFQDEAPPVGGLDKAPHWGRLSLALVAAIIVALTGGKIEVTASEADGITVAFEVTGYHIGGGEADPTEARSGDPSGGEATATILASDHPRGYDRRSGETHVSSATGRSLGTPWVKAAERKGAEA